MQVVGTASLGIARRPGAAAVGTLVGNVALFVLIRFWKLVRGGAAALRRRRGTRAMGAGSYLAPVTARLAVDGPRLVASGSALHAPAFHAPVHAPVHAAPAPHELVLPADPTAPRRARALLQVAAQEWDVDEELYQDAAMVVTELVANAVDHARTPSTLTLGLDDRGLSVAVRDGHCGPLPRPRPVDPGAPRGRGLQMIAALACSWGVTTRIDGKTVWAVLPRHYRPS